MRIDEFNKAVKEQLLTCENLLLNKGHEYAPDAVETNEVDRPLQEGGCNYRHHAEGRAVRYVGKAHCIGLRYVHRRKEV